MIGIVTFLVLLAIDVATTSPPFPAILQLQLRIPRGVAGRSEPIVSTGFVNRGDFLFATYQSENAVVITYESWGRGISSPTITYKPDVPYAFQLEMPSVATAGLNPTHTTAKVRVSLDGIDVLRSDVPFFPCRPDRVFFGANPVGGAMVGTLFRGEIATPEGRRVGGNGREIFSSRARLRAWATSQWWHVLPLALLGLGVARVAESVRRRKNDVAARTVRRLWGTLQTHAWFLVLAVLNLLVFTWLMTGGTFRLIYPDAFGAFYDAQAQSLLRGQLDVPEWALGSEAFVVNGKYYGYFGITPALLRLPILFWNPDAFGHMTRGWMLAGFAACLLGAHFLLCHAFRVLRGEASRPSTWAVVLLMLAAGLGSTLLFLATRVYVYHEAILCGTAFGIWSSYFSFRYLAEPRTRWWISALVGGTLAAHGRPPSGLFALALLGCVALAHLVAARKNPGSWRIPLAVGALAAVGFLSLQMVAYLKFGTLDGAPLRYHAQFTPERLAKVEGKNFHLENVRHNLDAYVLRAGFQAGPRFPFFIFDLSKRKYPEAKIDLEENVVGVLYSMAGLITLGIAGCAGFFTLRSVRQPLLLVLLASLPLVACLLTFVSTSHRYTADFWLPLTITGIFGLVFLDSLSRPLRVVLLSIATAASLFSFAVTMGVALHFQVDLVWGVPEEVRSNFYRIRQHMDRWFPGPR